MRRIIVIAKRDLLSLFASPLAYFVLAAFLLMACFFFFNLLGTYNVIINHYSGLPQGIEYLSEQQFSLNSRVVAPYYRVLVLLLVLVVPLLTMRTIADERRSGTYDLVITSRVSRLELLLGKLLGCLVFVGLLISFATMLPLVLWAYGEPPPEIAPILAGALALIVCGAAFSAIGVAASASTESPAIAAVLATSVLLMLCVVHAPTEAVSPQMAALIGYLSPLVHLERTFDGVVTLSTAVYFSSLVLVAITAAFTFLEREAVQ